MTQFNRRRVILGSGALAAAAAAAPLVAQPAAPISLKGKSFLVTGTSSGFGNLGALHYARAGAKVFATMRNLPRPQAAELRAVARAEKLDLTVLELDVLSDRSVARAIAEAERLNGGPLDVLVNNAGINISGPVEVQDLPSVQLSFDTNVFGMQRTMRGVLPGMRARKSGLIFNVSSQQGRIIMPGMGVYSATKFAVESLSEQIAYELAPHGIEVTIIEPGGFPTNIGANRARLTAALAERVEPRHAAGYPEALAQMKASARSMPTGPAAQAAMARAYGGVVPDPLDVPRAIAEIAAMPAGTRPLRRPVHPGHKPQLEINRVSADTQRALLSRPPHAEWARAVLD
jgi:NAD(P)-dependent dehydrogenase (short-subunit alcohol dehydrogenase family)